MGGQRRQDGADNGLGLALIGFITFTFGDAMVKTMVAGVSPPEIAAIRFTIGALGLGLLVLLRKGRPAFGNQPWRWQLLRGGGITVATTAFFTAMSLMPLATATSIGFTSPILTSLLAAALLGEKIRRPTVVAALAAFAGTLIILRPNFAALGWAALLPLLAALGTAGMMVGNRAISGRTDPLVSQFWMAAIAAPLLILAALVAHWSGAPKFALSVPAPHIWLLCSAVAVTASTSHWLIYLASRRSGAGTVAPLTYVQLIVALVLGAAVFGDRPDAVALAGAAVIHFALVPSHAGESLVEGVTFAAAGVVVVAWGAVVGVTAGTECGIVVTGLVLAATKPTITPDTTPEPTKMVWVRRRTREKRRSRSWGVGDVGLMCVSFPDHSRRAF